MSKYSIDSTTLTSIGNAIRTKDGTSAPIQVSDFATRINAIPSGSGLTLPKLYQFWQPVIITGNSYYTQHYVCNEYNILNRAKTYDRLIANASNKNDLVHYDLIGSIIYSTDHSFVFNTSSTGGTTNVKTLCDNEVKADHTISCNLVRKSSSSSSYIKNDYKGLSYEFSGLTIRGYSITPSTAVSMMSFSIPLIGTQDTFDDLQINFVTLTNSNKTYGDIEDILLNNSDDSYIQCFGLIYPTELEYVSFGSGNMIYSNIAFGNTATYKSPIIMQNTNQGEETLVVNKIFLDSSTDLDAASAGAVLWYFSY